MMSTATEAMPQRLRSFVHLFRDEAVAIGWLRVEGWVAETSGNAVRRVRARVGNRAWTADYGLPRPDVPKVCPNITNPSSGFRVEVPVDSGDVFLLFLEAATDDGSWELFSWHDVVIPGNKPGLLGRAARRLLGARRQRPHFHGLTNGLLCWIDAPADWRRLPRRFRIIGWCLSKDGRPIEAIRARFGTREFPANRDHFRPDVAGNWPDRPDAFKSGFEIEAEAPRGSAILRLEGRLGGDWHEILSRKVRGPLIDFQRAERKAKSPLGDYEEWIRRYDTLRLHERRRIHEHVERFTRRPLISVIMPVHNPNPEHLRAAINSVRAQLYPHWELCMVDDASSDAKVRTILSRFAKIDRRIQVRFRKTNGGIAVASNEALDLTKGEFVALLDHDDELGSAALYFVAREINRHPDAQLIYSDEDKLDPTGRRTNPHFKCDWNGTLFLAQNYVSHLSVYRGDLIRPLRFRAGFEGSQDYDLVLRASEKIEPRQIRHIPRILYHWRMTAESAALNFQAKPKARAAAVKAVQEHLGRRQIAARVERTELDDFQRIRYQLPEVKPSVSIVIPTRDLLEQLRFCIESILGKTTYPKFEILLIDNGSREPATLAYLAQLATEARVRVLRQDEEFNYGRLNNVGVRESRADFVALLNNDLTVITPDWLEEMVSQARQPHVGAVGARLLFPDGRIQHAGVILGAGGGGLADHAHKGLPPDNHGYFARASLAQEVSAVTAACMLVRRSIYLEVGGFEEERLKVAFNDVDFCLRLQAAGYRIIYTPYAELQHWESASRGLEDTLGKHQRFSAEVDYVKNKWPRLLAADPFYNANLALRDNLFTLAFPPRLGQPWEEE
jgi:GT2 family glycosyltransferase